MELNKKSNGQEYYRGTITEFREALSAVSKCGSDLKIVSEDLRNNSEIVRAAVSNCGLALEFAGDDMQDRESVVVCAIINCGMALQHASERLRDNIGIVATAVYENPGAIRYASKRLRDNPQLLASFIISPEMMEFAKEDKYTWAALCKNAQHADEINKDKYVMEAEMTMRTLREVMPDGYLKFASNALIAADHRPPISIENALPLLKRWRYVQQENFSWYAQGTLSRDAIQDQFTRGEREERGQDRKPRKINRGRYREDKLKRNRAMKPL
jgi:hypothetical protein